MKVCGTMAVVNCGCGSEVRIRVSRRDELVAVLKIDDNPQRDQIKVISLNDSVLLLWSGGCIFTACSRRVLEPEEGEQAGKELRQVIHALITGAGLNGLVRPRLQRLPEHWGIPRRHKERLISISRNTTGAGDCRQPDYHTWNIDSPVETGCSSRSL